MTNVTIENKINRYDANLERNAAEAVYRTANQISELCKSLAAVLKSTDDVPLEIDNALSMCEDDFPQAWLDRFNRINNDR